MLRASDPQTDCFADSISVNCATVDIPSPGEVLGSQQRRRAPLRCVAQPNSDSPVLKTTGFIVSDLDRNWWELTAGARW
jgi:hypothetical protein